MSNWEQLKRKIGGKGGGVSAKVQGNKRAKIAHTPASRDARQKSIEINQRLVRTTTCSELLDIINKSCDDFDAINCATSLHRLGTKANEGLGLAKTRAHKGFVRLCAKTNEFLDKPGAYRPRELANIASGWAKLEAKQPLALLKKVSAAARRQSAAFDAQATASLAWACATLNYQDSALMAVLAEGAQRGIVSGTSNAQDLATTIWAFAKLEVQYT
jgi:hypothetical protein